LTQVKVRAVEIFTGLRSCACDPEASDDREKGGLGERMQGATIIALTCIKQAFGC
jgi:hypothetical protein